MCSPLTCTVPLLGRNAHTVTLDIVLAVTIKIDRGTKGVPVHCARCQLYKVSTARGRSIRHGKSYTHTHSGVGRILEKGGCSIWTRKI